MNAIFGQPKEMSPIEIFFGDGRGIKNFLEEQGILASDNVKTQGELYTPTNGRLRVYFPQHHAETAWFITDKGEEGLNFTRERLYEADPNEWH